jgi:UDP-MurNAc hydroxylase
MEFRYYGNACFSIIHKGIHILCDPWLDAPAVASGWEKFPPSKVRAKDISDIDYIYISHIHSDHCEPQTLAVFDKNIPVIAIDRQPDFLERMIRAAGFKNLIMIREGGPHRICAGLAVEVFGVSTPHICAEVIDSSAMFDFGDRLVLNCNDNQPSKEFCEELAKRYKSIDLALLPSGGGSGYPAMYSNLSDDEKERIANDAINKFTRSFVTAVDALAPRVVVPVAGGFMIRGKHATYANKFQVKRTDLTPLVEEYKQRGNHSPEDVQIIAMQADMVLDVDSRSVIAGNYHVWSEGELEAYWQELSKIDVKGQISTTSTFRRWWALLDLARANLWEKQKNNQMLPNYRVYLNVNDQLVEISLSGPGTKIVDKVDESAGPYMILTLNQDTFIEWMLGFEDFNMLDSGHRIQFYREPNVYVVEAYYLMSLLRI